MSIARRTLGFGTLLLSILGLTVCLAVIVGVWMVKARVEAVSNAALDATDQTLAFVDDKLRRVEEILKRGQHLVTLLSKAAERLQRQEPRAKEEVTSLLEQLDNTVFQELRSAQSWLDFAHAIAVGVDTVSEAVVTSDYAATRHDTVGVALAERLRESSESVAEILAKVQSLREELAQLRDTAVVPREVATRLLTRAVDLEEMMNRTVSGFGKLEVRVSEIRTDAGDLKHGGSWWTMVAAFLLTLLPAWFAVSQVVMALQGWRLMRGAR